MGSEMFGTFSKEIEQLPIQWIATCHATGTFIYGSFVLAVIAGAYRPTGLPLACSVRDFVWWV